MKRGNIAGSRLPGLAKGIEPEDTSITAPFDPTEIRVSSRLYTIDLLLTRIRLGELDLAPGFQRKGGIWTDIAASRLVESILIRIPLPAFYMDASNEEKWVVIDGLQRLTVLRKFSLDCKLKLEGLEFLTQYDQCTYADLPRSLQRRIQETQVTVFLIEPGTPPEVKFNIFKRINTGGLPLSPQEIRHVINQGPATLFLEKLSKSKAFKEATGNSVPSDRMADVECVLRFMAFRLTPYEEYKAKDFDTFLNDAMASLNRMTDSKRGQLAAEFQRAMAAAHEVFGRHAFRKRYDESDRRWPVNKALLEAWAVNLARLDDQDIQKLAKRRNRLIGMFIQLMHDPAFENAISQGTGNVNKVRTRFSSIEGIIQEVLP